MKKTTVGDIIVIGALGVVCVLGLAEISPSKGDQAAKAFDQAQNSGASDAQLCRSAQAIERTYRANGEGSKADHWQSRVQTYCLGSFSD